MAAALRFVFSGPRPGGPDLAQVRLESLSKTLTDRRILTVLGFWVVLNIVFGLGAVSITGAAGDIAWEAHIGGFLFGLLCFGFFDTSRKLPVPRRQA
jgi:membrane associated rhomboid family serine protease